jgi:heptosyltransferase I
LTEARPPSTGVSGDKPAQPSVLVVKTSSMGDLVHTLSAVAEAKQHLPMARIDWVCEETFADVARIAGMADRVIPVAIRRWRKRWWAPSTWAEIRGFTQQLRAIDYDAVIDAQGLIKTAWITSASRCASGQRWGFDRLSIREPIASWPLRHTVHAPMAWHAIERLRTLFGAALGYVPSGPVACVPLAAESDRGRGGSSILFLHGTSRPEKSWPIDQWIALGQRLADAGYRVDIPWGSDRERRDAEWIAGGIGTAARVLPKMSIADLARALDCASGAVGVDSGLMHLSAALGRPTVAIMAASHIPRFSATRFAPSWAAHAVVIESVSQATPIDAAGVFAGWMRLHSSLNNAQG